MSIENMKCPFCAEPVKVEAKICKHCGSNLATKEIQKKIKKHFADLDKEKLLTSVSEKLNLYPKYVL